MLELSVNGYFFLFTYYCVGLSSSDVTNAPLPCFVPALNYTEILNLGLDYGEQTNPGAEVTSGSSVSIHCKNGYTTVSKIDTFTCENGTWSPPSMPKCEKGQITKKPGCKVPSILYGKVKSDRQIADDGVPVGDSITVSCNQDSRLQGSSKLICQRSIQWDGVIPVCIPKGRSCPLPSLLNKRMKSDLTEITNLRARIKPGREVEFGCEREYHRVGHRYVQCQKNGAWNKALPYCWFILYSTSTRQCFLPKIQNGDFIKVDAVESIDIIKNGLNNLKYKDRTALEQGSSHISPDFTVGTILAARCKPGYKSTREHIIIECHTSMPFAPLPRCEKIPDVRSGFGPTRSDLQLILGSLLTLLVVIAWT